MHAARTRAYSGTFLCAEDQTDFETVRAAFLGEAVGDTEEVTGPPAGRDEPYPFQVAFHHAGVGAGRVFWDDVGVLCSAELQTVETDLGVVRRLLDRRLSRARSVAAPGASIG